MFEEHCDTVEEEVCESITENVCSTSTEEVCHTNEIEVCDDHQPHNIHVRQVSNDNLVVNRDLFDAPHTQSIGETNAITAKAGCDPNEIECFQTTECKAVVQEVCFTANEVTQEEKCQEAGAANCFENLVEECQDPVTRTGCVQLHSSVASHVASQQLVTPFVHGSVAGGLTFDGLPPRLSVPAVPPAFEAEPRQPKSGGCRIEAVQECEAVPRTECAQVPQQECHLVPRQQCRNVPVEKLNRVC